MMTKTEMREQGSKGNDMETGGYDYELVWERTARAARDEIDELNSLFNV